MRAPSAAALLALTLVAGPGGAAADTWLGVAAGGGWESNLNLGVADAPEVSASFATGHAHAGGSLDLASWAEAGLELAWDGVAIPEYSELGSNRPSATVDLAVDLGRRARLRLAGESGLRLAADPARRGWDAGGSATLRLLLLRPLTLRASDGYLSRQAGDPAYAGQTVRGRAGLDLRLGGALTVSGAWTVEVGDTTVSTSLTTFERLGGQGRRPGDTTTALGSALVFQSVPTTLHGALLGLSLRLGAGLRVEARLRRTWLEGDGLSGAATTAGAELAWSR